MPRTVLASFERPHEVNERSGVREVVVELEGVSVGRVTHEPGWRWRTHVRPVVGTERCVHRHVGMVLSGCIVYELDDGSRHEATAGMAFDVPPGHDAWVVGDAPAITVEWVGLREWLKPLHGERVLASLLFTDIVDSTALAARLGDVAWRARLEAHDAAVRQVLLESRGAEVKTTGDGFLCRFEGVAQALSAAMRLRERVRPLGLEVRQGLHVGEVEVRGGDVAGVAVHEAARVASRGGGGARRRSAIAAALAGAQFSFESLGAVSLKGLDGPREHFRLLGRR